MWAISGVWFKSGKVFLYEGTFQTRKRAVAQHSRDKEKTWQQCRRDGDQAVKVVIEWKRQP